MSAQSDASDPRNASVMADADAGGSSRLRDVGPAEPRTDEASWPAWAMLAVSIGLTVHLGAVVFGALGVPPSSLLERRIAGLFAPYHDLVDQGYAYRYYAEPPPTPVILATLHYDDGRPTESLRLPERGLNGPPLRHQRQLALAHALYVDVQEARHDREGSREPRLGMAYSRHLCRTHPGCRRVTLHMQEHLIPDPEEVRHALESAGSKGFDLFDDVLFTPPQRIGDYSCDGS